jgi:hypothetical protein
MPVLTVVSLPVLQLSEVKRNGLNLELASERTAQINLYLLTRVLSIVERRIVEGHGRSVAGKPHARRSSVADGGMCPVYIYIYSNAVYRFSVLPALALEDGIIHCDILEGAFDSEQFFIFIDRLLDQMQPFPAPKSVIVMDNCRIHKHKDTLAHIESRYVFI